MKAEIYKKHKKIVLYIAPVGKEYLPPEIIECECQVTKGENHVHSYSKKETQ